MNRLSVTLAMLALFQIATNPVLGDMHNHASQPQADHATGHISERVGTPYPLLTDPLGDPLADVDSPVVVLRDGRELRFANEENLAVFNSDPKPYLSKVDRQLIKQQKSAYPLATCVVSGEKLGGDMGEPIDYVYGNRLVRFCCKMCRARFNHGPDAYLARIDKAVIESQKAEYPMNTCVVSGEELGDMGEPVDFVIGTRLVRFCCPMCIKQFEANPAHYLSKLDDSAGHQKDEGEVNDNEGDKSAHQSEPASGDGGHQSNGEHH